MRAIVFEQNGGPEVLEAQDVPAPDAGEGEVLVDVEAVGINYRDVYERQGGGYGSPPPATIGVEGAGRIHDSGERVAWVAVPGSYAEQVAASRGQLVPVPDGVSSEVAAAALLQGMTAHYLAADSYPVENGDWVLVQRAGEVIPQVVKPVVERRTGNEQVYHLPEKCPLCDTPIVRVQDEALRVVSRS